MKIKMIESSIHWEIGDMFDAVCGGGGFSFYLREVNKEYLSLHSIPSQMAEVVQEDATTGSKKLEIIRLIMEL